MKCFLESNCLQLPFCAFENGNFCFLRCQFLSLSPQASFSSDWVLAIVFTTTLIPLNISNLNVLHRYTLFSIFFSFSQKQRYIDTDIYMYMYIFKSFTSLDGQSSAVSFLIHSPVQFLIIEYRFFFSSLLSRDLPDSSQIITETYSFMNAHP